MWGLWAWLCPPADAGTKMGGGLQLLVAAFAHGETSFLAHFHKRASLMGLPAVCNWP